MSIESPDNNDDDSPANWWLIGLIVLILLGILAVAIFVGHQS